MQEASEKADGQTSLGILRLAFQLGGLILCPTPSKKISSMKMHPARALNGLERLLHGKCKHVCGISEPLVYVAVSAQALKSLNHYTPGLAVSTVKPADPCRSGPGGFQQRPCLVGRGRHCLHYPRDVNGFSMLSNLGEVFGSRPPAAQRFSESKQAMVFASPWACCSPRLVTSRLRRARKRNCRTGAAII